MSSTGEALILDPRDRSAVAIVPARLASTRLSRKMLLDLAGAPLIVRVCENLARTQVFSEVVVAHDSHEIGTVVRAAGFADVMTDPGLASGTDRVAACAKTMGLPPDSLVVNVQGDEPFLPASALTAVVERLRICGRDIVTARAPYVPPAGSVQPDVVKVVTGVDDRALYFSRANVPAIRDGRDEEEARAAGEVPHARHIGIYGFRADVLAEVAALAPHPLERLERLEQLRWLAHGYGIRAVRLAGLDVFGIDTAADLARANARYLQTPTV